MVGLRRLLDEVPPNKDEHLLHLGSFAWQLNANAIDRASNQ